MNTGAASFPLLLILFSGALCAENDIYGNQEFLDQLIDAVSEDLIQQIDTSHAAYKYQFTETKAENSVNLTVIHYVQNRIYDFFDKQGLLIHFSSTTDTDSSQGKKQYHMKLRVGVLNAGVWYDRWIKESILGKGSLLRSGKLELDVALVAPDNKMLAHYASAKAVSDTISSEYITKAQQGDQLFGALPLPKRRNWKKLVEPILAIGTSSAIVFLFYYIRSRN